MISHSWRSLAVAAVLFTGVALPASAATTDINCVGPCSNTSVNIGDVGANPTSLTGQFNSNVSTQGFMFHDYVAFNLTSTSPVFLTSSSATNPFVNGGSDMILNFRVSLFSGTPPAANPPPAANQIGATVNAVYTGNATAGFATINFPAQLLNAPGSYFLLFEGAGGNFSGFSGVVTATPVNAVPLPGALTLFGTGMLGLLALRRRRKSQEVAA